MIELYAFATPNSIKVSILIEELGAEYRLHPVNIREGEQKRPEFLGLNPNGKVPVIVDPDGPGGGPITVTESAAILVYLAEKHGRFLAREGDARVRAFEWLLFHASGLGPAFGQAGYFQKLAPEPVPFAIERFKAEAMRTLHVLDSRLAQSEYLAGDEISIADIANFGWIWRRAFAGVDLVEMPNVERWYAALDRRPAVGRAIARLSA